MVTKNKNKKYRVETHFPKFIVIFLICLLSIIFISTFVTAALDGIYFIRKQKGEISDIPEYDILAIKDFVVYPWIICSFLFFLIATIGIFLNRSSRHKKFIAGGVNTMYRLITAGTGLFSLNAVLWTVSYYISVEDKGPQYLIFWCVALAYILSYALIGYSIYISKQNTDKNDKVINAIILKLKDIATNAKDKQDVETIYDIYNDIAHIEKSKLIPSTEIEVKTKDTSIKKPTEDVTKKIKK